MSGLGLGLCLAEVVVRVVAPQRLVTEHLRWELHDEVGMRLQPHTIVAGEEGGRINGLGLRDDDIGPKPEGQWRLLALGDSFTFGAGVATEEAFPQVLEAELSLRSPGRQRRVINAGTVGYGTRREWLWLQAFGDQLQLDEVLLAVFVGNDFADNLNMTPPTIVDGRRVHAALAEQPKWWVRVRIAAHASHLYRMLHKLQVTHREIDHEWRLENQPVAIGRGLNRRRLSFYMVDYGLRHEESERLQKAWQLTREALDGIHSWCTARQIPLKLMVIPDILQVEGDLEATLQEHFGVGPKRMHITRTQDWLTEWCQASGVPLLDLLKPFQRETDTSSESLHLGYDPHWNARGHALGARLLADRFWLEDASTR